MESGNRPTHKWTTDSWHSYRRTLCRKYFHFSKLGWISYPCTKKSNLIRHCCSVTESCLTLCYSMDCSMPGFPVLHHLSELAKSHVHWVGDAIQPTHSLSSPSLPAFNLSQHQGLFKWVSSLHQVAKVLELQHQSFQWMFRVDIPYNWLVGSPCSSRESQESSLVPQFNSINSLALSLLDGPTLTSMHDPWKDRSFDYTALCWRSNVSAFEYTL